MYHKMIFSMKHSMILALEDRLSLANAARKQILGSNNPITHGKIKRRLALNWIYRWSFSTPKIIDLICGAKATGYSAKLEKAGLIRRTRTESGGAVEGVPNFVLTLTELGVSEVERFATSLLPYELNPYKAVNQNNLRHDVLVQLITANILRNADFDVNEFVTPKEFATYSTAGVKQFDCIWVNTDGRQIGIEMELSAKWSRKLDQFVESILLAVQKKVVDYVWVFTDSPAIHERYTKSFTPGTVVQRWAQNSQKQWVVHGQFEVPTWAEERVTCNLSASASR